MIIMMQILDARAEHPNAKLGRINSLIISDETESTFFIRPAPWLSYAEDKWLEKRY